MLQEVSKKLSVAAIMMPEWKTRAPIKKLEMKMDLLKKNCVCGKEC